MAEVTQILEQITEGDPDAASLLLPLVYDELRKLASRRVEREPSDAMLQATALVHEAYLRLVGDQEVQWDSRGHFFAAAAQAMRRILVDQARQRHSLKRGGDRQKQELLDVPVWSDEKLDDLLDLDSALTKLQESEPEMAQLVQLRYFSGLSISDTAKVLGMTERTVKRHWAYARAWLGRELQSDQS